MTKYALWIRVLSIKKHVKNELSLTVNLEIDE